MTPRERLGTRMGRAEQPALLRYHSKLLHHLLGDLLPYVLLQPEGYVL